jgi:hypothetical protein
MEYKLTYDRKIKLPEDPGKQIPNIGGSWAKLNPARPLPSPIRTAPAPAPNNTPKNGYDSAASTIYYSERAGGGLLDSIKGFMPLLILGGAAYIFSNMTKNQKQGGRKKNGK